LDATQELQILDVAIAVSGLLLAIFMAIVIRLNQTIDIRIRQYAYSLLIALGGFSASGLAMSSALLFGDAHAGLLIHGGTFFIYVFACFFSISITHYFMDCLGLLRSHPTLHFVLIGYFLVEIALLVISQFTGLYYTIDTNFEYHRAPFFWLPVVLMFALLIVDLVLLILFRERLNSRQQLAFAISLLLPFFGRGAQVAFSGMHFSLTASILAVFILFYELIASDAEQHLQRKQQNLEMQADLLTSQIRPHFMFNSLNAIHYLIGEDPYKAQRAVNDFSDYLRANVDAFNSQKTIPFWKERAHVESYLRLEKLASPDSLEYVFECPVQDFLLPSMCVQPLVENAVQHGTRRGGELCSVKISTRDDDDSIAVCVEDDGVGFDAETLSADDSHVGIGNVRKRVELISKGTLEIESVSGKGTVATIRLPKMAHE